MRPIDGDALVAKLDDWRGDIEDVDEKDAHDVAYYSAMSRALRFAKDAHTLDYEPVRHNQWALHEMNPHRVTVDGYVVCLECEHSFDRIKGTWFKRCPNCGAKMDGGKHD